MRSTLVTCVAATTLLLPWASNANGQTADFTQATRDLRQGIFLVGSETNTGTAWVISKQHRLLATNAHVADMFYKNPTGKFLAMMNGSDQTYVVKRVWYHPGVRRFPTKDENLSVRSTDSKLGEVDPLGPDVAVLQLSSTGPDLPLELKFARPKVLFDLQALPSAILGYPGHDTAGWPKPGKKAQATFHVGTISRVTDYQLDSSARDELAQYLQYTMESFGGFSGSPVFLASGEVVGLHNSARPADPKGGNSRWIAHGVRVDALWELLAYHALDDRVAIPMPAARLLLKRWSDPDPNWDLYLKLAKLVDDADYLIGSKLDFAAGIAKCDEAIALRPSYAPAYRTRCIGLNNFYFRFGKSWTTEKRIKVLELALSDATQNLKLHPGPTVDAIQTRMSVYNNLGVATKDKSYYLDGLKDAETILKIKKLTAFERSWALSSKAACLGNLGNKDEAQMTHLQALQADPDNAVSWDNRADFFQSQNQGGPAQLDRAMAKALRKKAVLLQESGRRDYREVSSVTGELTNQDSKDQRGCYRQVFGADLEAGYYYQIDLKNPAFRSNKDYDPILKLADDKGNVLVEDDDGGAYPNARIFFTPKYSATYRLAVTSYVAGQTGPFTLTVVRIAKDQ